MHICPHEIAALLLLWPLLSYLRHCHCRPPPDLFSVPEDEDDL